MFDPIIASQEIKDSYIDYITTTFHMADPDYAKEFRRELTKEGMVAKGAFLDIGGSFETGRTLHNLMEEGRISPLFQNLEPIAEKDKDDPDITQFAASFQPFHILDCRNHRTRFQHIIKFLIHCSVSPVEK